MNPTRLQPRFPRHRDRLFRGLVLAGLAFVALTAIAAEPFRVALFNFNVEELSYRSSQAAAELTALLQAELGNDPPPDLHFVERADLGRAAEELALGGMGLADRQDGLRAGHWYLRAAQAGSAPAICRLADLWSSGAAK